MSNQCETLILSRPKYILSLFYQTNNTELKSTIGFNASIYNSGIDYI